MRKLILLCGILILSLSVFSQNGGQTNENENIKLEYYSHSNGFTTFRITNKQAIEVLIEVKAQGQEIQKAFDANAVDTVIFSGLTGTNVKITARPLDGNNATLGIVELYLNIDYLPVKFGIIKIKRRYTL